MLKAKTRPASLSSASTVYRRVSGRWFAVGAVVVGAILFSGPLWASEDLLRSGVDFLSLLALAQIWNLLAGFAGLVSIGQQAWIGLGAYTLVVVVDDLQQPVVVAMLVAGIVPALLAIPTATLLFRLRGGYFSVGTWVIAEVFRLLITNNTDWLRGGNGRTLDVSDMDRDFRGVLTYLLAVVIGLGATGLVYGLMRTRLGLALTAIRDSETAAASLGINLKPIKYAVFILGAFATGVTGALIYLNLLRVTPDGSFSPQWTAYMIFIVVIGGIGTIEGPIIGAFLFYIIRQYLSDFGEWSIILLGAIAIFMMLFAPEGLWGIVQRRFRLEIFPVRRLLTSGPTARPLPPPESV